MGRKLTSYNGEDEIYTPDKLANAIIQELKPKGVVLEPCMGDGAFTRAITNYGLGFEWCEINRGVDFFDKETTNAEWMITNPPFSKVFKFIKKGIELKIENIALLVTINTIWMNGKLNYLKDNGYQLTKIYLTESPYFRRIGNWRQSGFSLGVLLIQKVNDNKPIKNTLDVGEILW